MTAFVPESIRILGTDAGGLSVVLCSMYVDTLADLPSPTAYTGFRLSMGCTARVINDNSIHCINSAGQWIQIAAGTATYTRAEIDAMVQQINATNAAQQAEINYLANTGAKNILDNTADASRTVAGITWIKNADGSMTATGTTTGVSAVRVSGVQGSSTYASAVPIPRGQYIISASGFDDETFRFAIGIFDAADASRVTRNIYNTPAEIEITTDTARFDFSCVISRSGVTAAGDTFYPMIRPAAIIDSTYQPYAPTNRQLYELIKQYHP